jgi:SAM-dependent methyltransferase
MNRIPYLCPSTREALQTGPNGLTRADGVLYRFLSGVSDVVHPVPNFLDVPVMGEGQRSSFAMYGEEAAQEMYRNFLNWLFTTFNEEEGTWRRAMTARLRLRPGDAVLVTGCGLGDDISPLLDAVGPGGEVHAQDLSPDMIRQATARWAQERSEQTAQLHFSVGDALHLPFASGAFDAAFHFGGINLYDDVGAGIAEMGRVVRPGGRVVVGDEGIAPWLRETDYGRMVVTNNPLWGRSAPIALLPETARDVTLDWVLGQCFWVIGFSVGTGLPAINPHIPHKGRRGGTMWTRSHGQLEGVTPETRLLVQQAAAAAGLSVHEWLEQSLRARLGVDQPSSRTATPKPVRP